MARTAPHPQPPVVVITGASSGIGKATALRFAREQGAHLVLAARREEALEETARACERAGGRALAVPTDVTRREEVEALARRAVEAYGRLDVWVNNAGVGSIGPLLSTPPETFQRVIDTDLMGYVHGARAALLQFRAQGGRGTLVNVGSIASRVVSPYALAYFSAKHAVRAFSLGLRQEVREEGMAHVQVCLVNPGVIDTPFVPHTANHVHHPLRAGPLAGAPERVARAIVSLPRRPRREVFVGHLPRLARTAELLAPALTERVMARALGRAFRSGPPLAGATDASLFTPVQEGTGVSGGWRERFRGVRWAVGAVGAVGALAAGLPLALGARRLLAAR
jgi:NAD(P)-dependent dehydrogenase (short-subunit alcohol dehydrogenase family)